VIAIIARNAINPQTKLPHPPARIELAMEEARVKIDLFKPAEEQVPDVLKVLRPLIPIKFEKKEVAVKVPPQYAGRAAGEVKHYGEVKRQERSSTMVRSKKKNGRKMALGYVYLSFRQG
jgi:ribosome maturation protein SDO1